MSARDSNINVDSSVQCGRNCGDNGDELDVADLTATEVEEIVRAQQEVRRRDLVCLVSFIESALGYIKYVDAISTPTEGIAVERFIEDDRVYVVHSQPQARVCEPAHLLLVDDKARRIVVAFRGSKQCQDWFTNIRCGSLPFPVPRQSAAPPVELPEVKDSDGRQAHSGMLQASVNLVAQLGKYLEPLVKKHPTYRIRVVGHSLGAGVAALFTLLIQKSYPAARAVVFAPPACVSESMVPEALECVTSFVNAQDCVPSVSAACMSLPLIGSGLRLVPPGKLLHLKQGELKEGGDAAAAASSDSRLAFTQAWLRDHKELGSNCCTSIEYVPYLRFCQFGFSSLFHATEHLRSSYKVSLLSLKEFCIAQLQALEDPAVEGTEADETSASVGTCEPFSPTALVVCLEGVLLDCAECVAQSARAALVSTGEKFVPPVLPVNPLVASFAALACPALCGVRAQKTVTRVMCFVDVQGVGVRRAV